MQSLNFYSFMDLSNGNMNLYLMVIYIGYICSIFCLKNLYFITFC